jgi:hypothetical protein
MIDDGRLVQKKCQMPHIDVVVRGWIDVADDIEDEELHIVVVDVGVEDDGHLMKRVLRQVHVVMSSYYHHNHLPYHCCCCCCRVPFGDGKIIVGRMVLVLHQHRQHPLHPPLTLQYHPRGDIQQMNGKRQSNKGD